MRMLESIKARATNYKAAHFEHFPEGKQLKKLIVRAIQNKSPNILHIRAFRKSFYGFFISASSSERFVQPVFFRMFRTWNFTVFSEINNCVEISLFEAPFVISLRTSVSRDDNSYFRINSAKRSSVFAC